MRIKKHGKQAKSYNNCVAALEAKFLTQSLINWVRMIFLKISEASSIFAQNFKTRSQGQILKNLMNTLNALFETYDMYFETSFECFSLPNLCQVLN